MVFEGYGLIIYVSTGYVVIVIVIVIVIFI